MKPCLTLSLVPSLRGGPWVLWDDLASGIRKTSELGFSAIELFTEGPSAGNPGELKTLLSENNLDLGAVGTGAGKVIKGLTLTDPDPTIRQDARKFVSDMIEFGAEHGAPAIIGSMQGSSNETAKREECLNWLREALEELGEKSKNAGTFLIYEPLNRYETNLFNRFGDACEFLDDLETEGVTLLADLFHMNIEEEDIAQSLRDGAKHVGHVHFADSNRRPVGYGHTRIEPIAQALAEIGYQGCVSAEAFDWPDPDTAARKTIESYHKYFS
jgi:sugar phosphate isomerase/epimerase